MKNLALLFSFLFIFGCKKLPEDRGSVIRDFDLGTCEHLVSSSGFASGYEMIYLSDLDNLENTLGCTVLSSFDPSSESVLVRSFYLEKYKSDFTSIVEIDDVAMTYRLTIYIKPKGTSNKFAYRTIAVVVPMVPFGYSVEYDELEL